MDGVHARSCTQAPWRRRHRGALVIARQKVRTQIWQTDARRIDHDRIREAASFLRKGRLVIFPTETVYGLGAAWSQKEAQERIFDLKERSKDKPLTWHVADYDFLRKQKIALAPLARELSWRFLPGPVTMIVDGQERTSVGLRFPDHPVALRVIEELGEPVLATSVNKSGDEAIVSGKKAARLFDGFVDLVLDGGVTHFGTDSTIVDFTVAPPRTVRRGPLGSEVEAFLQSVEHLENPESERILFVCTGNTCRSVMAGGWLNAEIKKRGLEAKVSVQSCGTGAMEGAPATLEAVQVVRNEGGEISGHRARTLSKKRLQEATRIFAMTAAHADAIVAADFDAGAKVTVLGIRDPLGMDLKVYRDTLDEIKEKLKGYLSWLNE